MGGDFRRWRGGVSRSRCAGKGVIASRWLGLAASPTFAAMGLASAVYAGDPAATVCSAMGGSPLGGMTMMYALMTFFHAAPWLKLASDRCGRISSGGAI